MSQKMLYDKHGRPIAIIDDDGYQLHITVPGKGYVGTVLKKRGGLPAQALARGETVGFSDDDEAAITMILLKALLRDLDL